MKVGELKKFLENYSDDVEVITITDNFEMGHNKVEARITETKCSKELKSFRDAFDGCRYSNEVFNYNDNGKIMLLISG